MTKIKTGGKEKEEKTNDDEAGFFSLLFLLYISFLRIQKCFLFV